jgi:hypothetical protein
VDERGIGEISVTFAQFYGKLITILKIKVIKNSNPQIIYLPQSLELARIFCELLASLP